ncbi:MAG: hypothetical protein ACLSDQ_00590 [Adlercreutzia equolifaciens]
MWRILGCVGVVYSLFLSWAAGVLGVILMCLLYVPGILMYIWGKRNAARSTSRARWTRWCLSSSSRRPVCPFSCW